MMETFTEKWLATREMEDMACRCPEILNKIEDLFKDLDQLTILDIGCGTGSTMRAMLPKLSQQQTWHLIDHDPALLRKAKTLNFPLLEKSNHNMKLIQSNLAQGFDFLNGNFNLVTTSALLDLVSENWMSGLIQALKANSTVFYSALTAGSSIEIKPDNPLDEKILSAFRSHQYKNKGFGPALGPDVNVIAKRMFEHAGYETHSREISWGVQNDMEYNRNELYPMFLEGIALAVEETNQVGKMEIRDWYTNRIESVEAEICEIRVLHEDLLAVPA